MWKLIAKLLDNLRILLSLAAGLSTQTWTADNGNGTYSNPLFYDEFADPAVIRVGPDFYLTGSSMMREPYPHGITKPIPYGRQIALTAHAHEPAAGVAQDSAPLTVVDRKLGRVAFRSAKGFLSVAKDGTVSIQNKTPGNAETFQWIETFTGELTLLSLETHRYLRVDFGTGALHVDSAGPEPNGPDGVRFDWQVAASGRHQ